MTNPTHSQDQDLRTALDGWRCQHCGCRTCERIDERKADGSYGPGGKVICVNCKSYFDAPAPPRPVNAERVEDAAETIARLEKELGVTGTANVFREALRLAKEAGAQAPAHSPDKAVTREGVDEVASNFEKHCADLIKAYASGLPFGGATAALAQFALDHRGAILAALAPKPTGTEAGRGDLTEADLAASVAETVKETGGWWMSCSGCHETNEGQATGHYPYSRIFQCDVGSGCRDCGGLGVRWEHYTEADFAAMAEDIATPTPPVSHSPDSGRLRTSDQLRIIAGYHGDKLPAGVSRELCDLADEWDEQVASLSPSPDSTGPAGMDKLRQAFRNADAEDWQRLDDLLGYSGHGRFWRAVFAEVLNALRLAALTPSAPIADPVRDDGDDAEVSRILAMSDAEVIAELEAEGRDPEALAEAMRGQMGATFKLCEEIKTLRDALAPFAAILANGEPVGPIPRGLLDSKLTRQDLRSATAAYRASLPASDVPGEAQTQEGGLTIIEASHCLASETSDWALTIQWSDGAETVEEVTERLAKHLGFDADNVVLNEGDE